MLDHNIKNVNRVGTVPPHVSNVHVLLCDVYSYCNSPYEFFAFHRSTVYIYDLNMYLSFLQFLKGLHQVPNFFSYNRVC